MLQAARRLRVPTHVAAFSTAKSDGPVKRQPSDVKPPPEPKIITEPQEDSLEWERRDPNFETMSKKVLGIIRTRPGGKQEMGDAVVTHESTRPKPMDRHTTLLSGPDEETVVASGTLNLKQLRDVYLLYQEQKMDVQSIAKQYDVDAELLQRVFQHTSLVVSDQAREFTFKDTK